MVSGNLGQTPRRIHFKAYPAYGSGVAKGWGLT